jgi:hypothetical protein
MNSSSQFIGLRRKLLSGVLGIGDPTSVKSETAVDISSPSIGFAQKSSKLHRAKTFLPQRRKGAKKTARNAAALCAFAPLREKPQI